MLFIVKRSIQKKISSFPSETKGEDQRVQTISNSFKFRCMTLSKETPHNGSRSNKGWNGLNSTKQAFLLKP